MKEASRLGAVVFRNNTGMLYNKDGTPVYYGLCRGSSDIIGWYHGRFLAIEVKPPGKKPTQRQQNFTDAVNRDGGIAGWVTDPDQIHHLLAQHQDAHPEPCE